MLGNFLSTLDFFRSILFLSSAVLERRATDGGWNGVTHVLGISIEYLTQILKKIQLSALCVSRSAHTPKRSSSTCSTHLRFCIWGTHNLSRECGQYAVPLAVCLIARWYMSFLLKVRPVRACEIGFLGRDSRDSTLPCVIGLSQSTPLASVSLSVKSSNKLSYFIILS